MNLQNKITKKCLKKIPEWEICEVWVWLIVRSCFSVIARTSAFIQRNFWRKSRKSKTHPGIEIEIFWINFRKKKWFFLKNFWKNTWKRSGLFDRMPFGRTLFGRKGHLTEQRLAENRKMNSSYHTTVLHISITRKNSLLFDLLNASRWKQLADYGLCQKWP